MCPSIGGNMGETWFRRGPIITRPYVWEGLFLTGLPLQFIHEYKKMFYDFWWNARLLKSPYVRYVMCIT